MVQALRECNAVFRGGKIKDNWDWRRRQKTEKHRLLSVGSGVFLFSAAAAV